MKRFRFRGRRGEPRRATYARTPEIGFRLGKGHNVRASQGSVQKLGDKRWRVRVSARTLDGRRTEISKVVRGSRRQAERVKHELLIEAGREQPSTDMTVREYAEAAYLPGKQAEVKASTLDTYRWRLASSVYPTLGDVPLRKLDAPMVRRWLSAFGNQKAAREAYKMLNMLCAFAVTHDRLPANPCERVVRPKVPRYEPDVLDAAQMAAYLDAFRGSRIEAAVLLAVGCGLRRGEICGLDVEDVDFAAGTVTVRRSYSIVEGRPRMDTPKSATSARTVHIPPALLERLRDIAPESGPVLVGRHGRLHPKRVFEEYRKTVRDAGLPYVPLKNLRHSSLTLAYDSGGRLLDVRDRAGHSSEAITAHYYVRPRRSGDAAIADAMGAALDAAACRKPTATDARNDVKAALEREFRQVTLEWAETF